MTEIELVKTIKDAVSQPGATNTYTLIVRNTSDVTARDVLIVDDVPAALEVIGLQSTKGDVVVAGQRVTAFPSVLNPGEEVSVMIDVRLRVATVAGEIVNIATVTTSTHGDTTTNNSDDAVLLVEVPPSEPMEFVDPVPVAPEPVAEEVVVVKPAAPQGTTQREPRPLLPSTGDPAASSWLGTGVLPMLLLAVVLIGAVGGVACMRRRVVAGASEIVSNAQGAAIETQARASSVRPRRELRFTDGTPRLGPELPQGAEPTALPPVAALDRVAALSRHKG